MCSLYVTVCSLCMLGRELTGANGYRWSRQYGVKNMGDDTYELVYASKSGGLPDDNNNDPILGAIASASQAQSMVLPHHSPIVNPHPLSRPEGSLKWNFARKEPLEIPNLFFFIQTSSLDFVIF